MQSLYKKKYKMNTFVYGLIIIGIIVINPFNVFSGVRSVAMVPLSPIIRVGRGIGVYISEHVNMILNIGTLYRHNQELLGDVRRLEAENALLQDMRSENTSLRTQLELMPRNQFTLITAEVVLRDPLGGDQWIMVNKGEKDGVENGDVVIVNENIFIGVIDNVDYTVARVRLVTNPKSVVNVVSVRTGAEAVALGSHGLSIKVEDIKKDADVMNGDMFITSNIGDALPRGLSVGMIRNVEISSNDLFQNGNITPLTPLNNLRFVSIIK